MALLLCFLTQQAGAFYAPEIYVPTAATKHAKFIDTDSLKDKIRPYAVIEKEFIGDAQKNFFYLLRDAHGNKQSQKNTTELLKTLDDAHQLQGLLLEGAEGPLDIRHLNLPSEDDKASKYLEILNQTGQMNGLEQFYVEREQHASDVPLSAFGLERMQVYRHGFKIMQKLFSRTQMIEQYEKRFTTRLRTLESLVLSSNLRHLVHLREQYNRGHFGISEYILALNRAEQQKLGGGLDISELKQQYPVMMRLLKLREIEGKLDHSKMEEEWQLFVKQVKPQLSSEMLNQTDLMDQLLNKGKQTNQEKINVRHYFEEVDRQTSATLNWDQWPALRDFAVRHAFDQEIDPVRLHMEIEQYYDAMVHGLIENQDQQDFFAIQKQVEMIFRSIRLARMPNEDASSIGHPVERRPSRIWTQINEMIRDIRGDATDDGKMAKLGFDDKSMRQLDFLFISSHSFYENSRKREALFMEVMNDHIEKNNGKKIALLAGGFHTDFLEQSLEAQNISYLTLRPHSSGSNAQNNAYRNLIMGAKAEGSVSNMLLFSILMPESLQRLAGGDYYETVRKPLLAEYSSLPNMSKASSLGEAAQAFEEIRHAMLRERKDENFDLGWNIYQLRLSIGKSTSLMDYYSDAQIVEVMNYVTDLILEYRGLVIETYRNYMGTILRKFYLELPQHVWPELLSMTVRIASMGPKRSNIKRDKRSDEAVAMSRLMGTLATGIIYIAKGQAKMAEYSSDVYTQLYHTIEERSEENAFLLDISPSVLQELIDIIREGANDEIILKNLQDYQMEWRLRKQDVDVDPNEAFNGDTGDYDVPFDELWNRKPLDVSALNSTATPRKASSLGEISEQELIRKLIDLDREKQTDWNAVQEVIEIYFNSYTDSREKEYIRAWHLADHVLIRIVAKASRTQQQNHQFKHVLPPYLFRRIPQMREPMKNKLFKAIMNYLPKLESLKDGKLDLENYARILVHLTKKSGPDEFEFYFRNLLDAMPLVADDIGSGDETVILITAMKQIVDETQGERREIILRELKRAYLLLGDYIRRGNFVYGSRVNSNLFEVLKDYFSDRFNVTWSKPLGWALERLIAYAISDDRGDRYELHLSKQEDWDHLFQIVGAHHENPERLLSILEEWLAEKRLIAEEKDQAREIGEADDSQNFDSDDGQHELWHAAEVAKSLGERVQDAVEFEGLSQKPDWDSHDEAMIGIYANRLIINFYFLETKRQATIRDAAEIFIKRIMASPRSEDMTFRLYSLVMLLLMDAEPARLTREETRRLFALVQNVLQSIKTLEGDDDWHMARELAQWLREALRYHSIESDLNPGVFLDLYKKAKGPLRLVRGQDMVRILLPILDIFYKEAEAREGEQLQNPIASEENEAVKRQTVIETVLSIWEWELQNTYWSIDVFKSLPRFDSQEPMALSRPQVDRLMKSSQRFLEKQKTREELSFTSAKHHIVQLLNESVIDLLSNSELPALTEKYLSMIQMIPDASISNIEEDILRRNLIAGILEMAERIHLHGLAEEERVMIRRLIVGKLFFSSNHFLPSADQVRRLINLLAVSFDSFDYLEHSLKNLLDEILIGDLPNNDGGGAEGDDASEQSGELWMEEVGGLVAQSLGSNDSDQDQTPEALAEEWLQEYETLVSREPIIINKANVQLYAGFNRKHVNSLNSPQKLRLLKALTQHRASFPIVGDEFVASTNGLVFLWTIAWDYRLMRSMGPSDKDDLIDYFEEIMRKEGYRDWPNDWAITNFGELYGLALIESNDEAWKEGIEFSLKLFKDSLIDKTEASHKQELALSILAFPGQKMRIKPYAPLIVEDLIRILSTGGLETEGQARVIDKAFQVLNFLAHQMDAPQINEVLRIIRERYQESFLELESGSSSYKIYPKRNELIARMMLALASPGIESAKDDARLLLISKMLEWKYITWDPRFQVIPGIPVLREENIQAIHLILLSNTTKEETLKALQAFFEELKIWERENLDTRRASEDVSETGKSPGDEPLWHSRFRGLRPDMPGLDAEDGQHSAESLGASVQDAIAKFDEVLDPATGLGKAHFLKGLVATIGWLEISSEDDLRPLIKVMLPALHRIDNGEINVYARREKDMTGLLSELISKASVGGQRDLIFSEMILYLKRITGISGFLNDLDWQMVGRLAEIFYNHLSELSREQMATINLAYATRLDREINDLAYVMLDQAMALNSIFKLASAISPLESSSLASIYLDLALRRANMRLAFENRGRITKYEQVSLWAMALEKFFAHTDGSRKDEVLRTLIIVAAPDIEMDRTNRITTSIAHILMGNQHYTDEVKESVEKALIAIISELKDKHRLRELYSDAVPVQRIREILVEHQSDARKIVHALDQLIDEMHLLKKENLEQAEDLDAETGDEARSSDHEDPSLWLQTRASSLGAEELKGLRVKITPKIDQWLEAYEQLEPQGNKVNLNEEQRLRTRIFRSWRQGNRDTFPALDTKAFHELHSILLANQTEGEALQALNLFLTELKLRVRSIADSAENGENNDNEGAGPAGSDDLWYQGDVRDLAESDQNASSLGQLTERMWRPIYRLILTVKLKMYTRSLFRLFSRRSVFFTEEIFHQRDQEWIRNLTSEERSVFLEILEKKLQTPKHSVYLDPLKRFEMWRLISLLMEDRPELHRKWAERLLVLTLAESGDMSGYHLVGNQAVGEAFRLWVKAQSMLKLDRDNEVYHRMIDILNDAVQQSAFLFDFRVIFNAISIIAHQQDSLWARETISRIVQIAKERYAKKVFLDHVNHPAISDAMATLLFRSLEASLSMEGEDIIPLMKQIIRMKLTQLKQASSLEDSLKELKRTLLDHQNDPDRLEHVLTNVRDDLAVRLAESAENEGNNDNEGAGPAGSDDLWYQGMVVSESTTVNPSAQSLGEIRERIKAGYRFIYNASQKMHFLFYFYLWGKGDSYEEFASKLSLAQRVLYMKLLNKQIVIMRSKGESDFRRRIRLWAIVLEIFKKYPELIESEASAFLSSARTEILNSRADVDVEIQVTEAAYKFWHEVNSLAPQTLDDQVIDQMIDRLEAYTLIRYGIIEQKVELILETLRAHAKGMDRERAGKLFERIYKITNEAEVPHLRLRAGHNGSLGKAFSALLLRSYDVDLSLNQGLVDVTAEILTLRLSLAGNEPLSEESMADLRRILLEHEGEPKRLEHVLTNMRDDLAVRLAESQAADGAHAVPEQADETNSDDLWNRVMVPRPLDDNAPPSAHSLGAVVHGTAENALDLGTVVNAMDTHMDESVKRISRWFYNVVPLGLEFALLISLQGEPEAENEASSDLANKYFAEAKLEGQTNINFVFLQPNMTVENWDQLIVAFSEIKGFMKDQILVMASPDGIESATSAEVEKAFAGQTFILDKVRYPSLLMPQILGVEKSPAEYRDKIRQIQSALRRKGLVRVSDIMAQTQEIGGTVEINSRHVLPAKRFVLNSLVGMDQADALLLSLLHALWIAPFENTALKHQLPDSMVGRIQMKTRLGGLDFSLHSEGAQLFDALLQSLRGQSQIRTAA